ncbi:MAG: site-specific DNA-methyltransferase [Gallionella sp.]
MQKIEATNPEAQSADIKAENIAQLKALFPELLTENANGLAINVDVLKLLVGDVTATDAEEKYGLNWHGKRRARQIAMTPSTGTLRPCPDESVDWATTQNLMIEGDNLEVLKLLQKSYAGKVKLIYIDPPYNTGKDFVYPDNFQDNIKNYLELTGQVEGGKKISSNTEASGRFHTDWLNMMYPRLKLARSLLAENGVIGISLDTVELASLKKVLDEVFGEENFVEVVTVVRSKNGMGSKEGFSTNSDFIIFYKKAESSKLDKPAFTGLPPSAEYLAKFDKSDKHGKYKMEGIFRKKGEGQRREESPGCFYPIYFDADGCVHLQNGTGLTEVFPKLPDGSDGRWIWSPEYARIRLHRLYASKGGTIYVKDYWDDGLREKPKSVWDRNQYTTEVATEEIKELLGEKVFDTVKPLNLMRDVVSNATEGTEIVLDFFAGSGTTGHAVMAQNASDNRSRRYILVQIPEPLAPENKDQKAAAEYCDKLGKPRTIAELTKERLRRAGAKVKADNPMFAGDTGFRVFKLDTSNIRAWNPDRDNLEKTLLDHEEHILPGRSEADIVYELLLKLGLDLCVPIASRTIAGKTVGAIGSGVLLACLAERISTKDVEALAQGIVAWRKELAPAGDTTCVFRDSAFENDIAKSNLAAILEQYGIANVRSL